MFDSYMIDKLSIAVHAVTSHILMLFSVDEKLLLKQVILFINFRATKLFRGISFFIKTHLIHFVCILVEANATCCLHKTMQQGFSFGR